MTDPNRISDDQHNNAPAVPQGYEIHEIPADYSGLVWLEGQVRAVARRAQAATGPHGWTDADSDAARLALELECLLMDTKDLSVVSKWWGSANDALELHRQRLAATPAPAPAQYKDRTPHLSVGESSFESWFGEYNPANKGSKQQARDAYAAGMGDPLVAPAPAQEPTKETFQSRYEREFMGRMAGNHGKLTEFCAALESFTHDYQRLYSTYKSYRDMISDLIKERDSLRDQVAKPAQEVGLTDEEIIKAMRVAGWPDVLVRHVDGARQFTNALRAKGGN